MHTGHESNPLRDSRDRRLTRIAGPSALVFFGVTGDLARKKLLPAVYDLMNRGLLPPSFGLVGYGRREWDNDDFRNYVRKSVEENARTPFREDVWNQFQKGMRFVRGIVMMMPHLNVSKILLLSSMNLAPRGTMRSTSLFRRRLSNRCCRSLPSTV